MSMLGSGFTLVVKPTLALVYLAISMSTKQPSFMVYHPCNITPVTLFFDSNDTRYAVSVRRIWGGIGAKSAMMLNLKSTLQLLD